MSTQRHDVNCSEAQIGGHAYFGHSDQMCFDDGVMHLATRQNLGERVAHELSYTQLTLRRTGLAMMSAGHAMRVLMLTLYEQTRNGQCRSCRRVESACISCRACSQGLQIEKRHVCSIGVGQR